VIGSFQIKPQSATLDPASPPSHGSASDPRHGDATPAHRSNRAFAFHIPGDSAMTRSDLALMFGAGALAVAGGVPKRNALPQTERTSEPDRETEDTSPIAELPALWLDRSLANAIQRQQGVLAAGSTQTRRPTAPKPDWLATPYRMPAATSAGIDNVDGWHEDDDWLVAQDRAGTLAADTADWLVVRE
jgi:hypothetical protein